MKPYAFVLPFKVRDYECDLQGIVNNSVYQNYLEHTRHEFLLSKGIDFAGLSRQGINLVVTRVELDFRSPLRSGDQFWVGLSMRTDGRIRFVFEQDIYREADQKLILNGMVTGTAIDHNSRPIRSSILESLIESKPSPTTQIS